MEATTKNQETGAGDKSARPAPPVLPWSVRLQLFALVTANDIAQRRDGTVNRFLFSFGDRQSPARPRPDAHGVRSADVTVDASRNLWARVYSPAAEAAGPAPLPVLVYFHGGGFTLLSATACAAASAASWAPWSSPSTTASRPSTATRPPTTTAWTCSATSAPPASPRTSPSRSTSRCFLGGDSAGGNIVHHVAQRWTDAPPPDSPVRLAGIILLQPYFGGEERTEAELRLEGVAPVVNIRRSDWAWRAFLPEGADRNHPAAHVTGQAGPEPELAEAFPPVMVAIGGMDPLKEWQERYVDMLSRKGKAVRFKKFRHAIHAFYWFPELPDSPKLLEEIKAFIKSNASIHHPAAL